MPMRRSSVRLLLTALLLLGCGMPLGAKTLKGEVVSVADGDTLTVLGKKGTCEKVRLQGIDAPERDQAFGTESGEMLSKLVKGKTVTVRYEEKDDYGRVLGTIFHKDKNINLEMVKRGGAWHYKHYAPDNEELAKAEAKARKAKLGLWKNEAPAAPWDFRHSAKSNQRVPIQPPPSDVVVEETNGTLEGTCTRVTDGDTLTIRPGSSKQETVQLFGIDAPERDQEYGSEATAALAALVLNKKIRVTYPGREDLGRINGKVYVDGKYVNLILVKEGHAWHSDKYGPNEDDLRTAQQEAREAGKGLWADARPLEPWRFRNGHY